MEEKRIIKPIDQKIIDLIKASVLPIEKRVDKEKDIKTNNANKIVKLIFIIFKKIVVRNYNYLIDFLRNRW